MAKGDQKTYKWQGKEFSAEELDAILEQHEKRKEYRSAYDPDKAKAYRKKREAQLKKDPEKWEAHLASRRKYNKKRQAMIKKALAFAKSRPEEFADFKAA